MTINYLNNSGQDRVQAGNNSGRMLGMFASNIMGFNNLRTQIETRKHLITHQTDESIRRDREAQRNKAIYGAAGKAAESEFGTQALVNHFNTIYSTYGEDHEEVKAGRKKATDYLHPELAAHATEAGIIRTPGALGTQFGSTAGEKAAEARALAAANARNNPAPTKEKPTKEPKATKPKFEPKPIKLGESGNPLLEIPKAGEFQGYTPRKTGTGGYDEAYKSGAIDKDTYDSYIEDSKKPGKDYMDTATSETVNKLVKERQDAEVNRNNHLNDGLDEGKK